jgi:hypothetical protein
VDSGQKIHESKMQDCRHQYQHHVTFDTSARSQRDQMTTLASEGHPSTRHLD